MGLFTLTKKMPANWFNKLHKTITNSDNEQVGFIKDSLKRQLKDFRLSKKDHWATHILICYCNTKEMWARKSKPRFKITQDHGAQLVNHLS